MKKFLSVFLLCSLASMSGAETMTARVNGMVCAFCAQGIEKKARALPATEDVYVNLQQKIVAVQVKAGQTLSAATLTELVREAGYDVTQIDTVDETTAAMRERMEQQGEK